MKVSDLLPDDRNANRGTERGRYMLERSLEKLGAGRSILLDKKGRIIAGNKTVEVAGSIGLEDVIVVQTDGRQLVAVQRTDLDLDTAQGREMAYADNRVAQVDLDFDPEQIKLDIEAGIELGDWWTAVELDQIVGPSLSADAGSQVNRADELQKVWQTETGQLWRLPSRTPGQEHRLICGDCTDAAVVERVMGGEKFVLCATSPPYTDQRDYRLGDFSWDCLMSGMFGCAINHCEDNAHLLFNLGLSHKDRRVDLYWDKWLGSCEDFGWPLFGWYVWDKGSGFPGEWNGRLAPSHEFVFHFNNQAGSINKWVETTGESLKRGAGGKRFRQKDGSLNELTSPDKIGQLFKIPDSVIRINREMARGVHTQSHPAVFSVEFAEFFINTWSTVGGIEFEPFLGSGTTIIAAENLARQCRAIEISPAYVAVSLQRYKDTFGIEPELVDEVQHG